jgi:hypothetical protein
MTAPPQGFFAPASTPASYYCPAAGGHVWVGTASGFPDGHTLTCALHAADPPAPPASVVTAMAFSGEGPTTATAAALALHTARGWLAAHGITPAQVHGPPVATLHARGGLGGVVVRYVVAYTLALPAAAAARVAAEEDGP